MLRLRDVEWFLTYKTHIIQKQLAIQFSETDRVEEAVLFDVPTVSAVEGCCLYWLGFGSSTLIEDFTAATITTPATH